MHAIRISDNYRSLTLCREFVNEIGTKHLHAPMHELSFSLPLVINLSVYHQLIKHFSVLRRTQVRERRLVVCKMISQLLENNSILIIYYVLYDNLQQ